MAEVIRKGIEAAQHDLVQDSNDILMEEVSIKHLHFLCWDNLPESVQEV